MAEAYTLKVSGSSNPGKVASSIHQALAEGKRVETISIGAGALNQAIKAIIIARGQLVTQGTDFLVDPSFATLVLEGNTRTAIRCVLELRQR